MRFILPLLLLSLCFSTLHAEEPPEPVRGKSAAIFNGKDLTGWEVIDKLDFEKHGKVEISDGVIKLGAGEPATGLRYKGKAPKLDYEFSLDARRTAGSDFFCGVTFPVGDSFLSLIVGGWGGGVTGVSNLDDMSAVENETTGYIEFKQNQWYKIRLRVTAEKVQAWVDKEKIVDVELKDRKLGIWWEQEPARPLGLVTWRTAAEMKEIRLRKLK